MKGEAVKGETPALLYQGRHLRLMQRGVWEFAGDEDVYV